ncbi:MAG: hypothetical protein U1D06_04125 [Paracoccaceae bacterium]|nr:hypothetical protein [Paracoccaceae bacterium]
MTDRQKTVSPPTATPPRQSGFAAHPSRGYSRLNDRFGLFIAAVVLLAPVPLASNRPVWWLLWGGIIGAGCALHLALGTRIAPGRPLQLRHHLPLMLAGLGVAGFALLQALPLAALLPEALRSLPASAGLSPVPRSISLAPDASLAGGLRVMIYLCFLALVLEVSSQPARAERIGWLLFAGLAAHAIWGLVALKVLGDTLLLQDKTAYRGFATGTFINRNSYATFLGFGIVLGIALTLGRTLTPGRTLAAGRPRRWSGVSAVAGLETLALWGLIGGMAITLVATQSRLGGRPPPWGPG